MAIQYKPTKQKKEKPAKAPKPEKAEKPMKFGSAKTIKLNKPKKVKEPKIKAPKQEKARKLSFSKPGKVQTNKPVKAEKLKKPNIFSKINPKLLIGGAVVLVAAIAVVVLTVVLPAIENHGMQIDYIMISQTPDNMVYLIGEEADYDGLRVSVVRKNGESFTVRANKCQISGFDSSTEGYKNITVAYEGFVTTFSVKVEAPAAPTPALVGIRLITLPKTQYRVGEWLDTTGGVILREYVDGTTAELYLVNSYVYGWENVKGPDSYTLTIKYMENGLMAETTYKITVE